ncbi:MAG: phosphoribosylamine--glycine ligase [Ignavibacteria bacterium]|nr:phosphoribosylamine--glycine ligase [Ignavibacteria bacterium]
MNILIAGNGGREHALATGIINSESFRSSNSRLYCTSGSAGLDLISKPVNIKPSDIQGITSFAESEKIDFVVVGPELPLSLGLADVLRDAGIKVFGPGKLAAEIESSKIFAKELMNDAGIPTAKFRSFNSEKFKEAFEYINEIKFPSVIKADGLAAGKGVIIVNSKSEAENAINSFTKEKIFGEAGAGFVIESYLQGYEVSLFAVTDGENYLLLPPSQDHKRIGEGDTGKNTGGMGAYAPLLTEQIDGELTKKIENKIIKPVLREMKNRDRKYTGCLYCGLMIAEENGGKEPYVIEFNCRFGDPETQAVLPLIKSDFLDLLLASVENRIEKYKLEFYDKYSCCVILSSGGYPDGYETGKTITGLDNVSDDCFVFHSGTKFNEDKQVITTGGRVLGVTALSEISHKDAIGKCYENVKLINFENCYFRRDIGYRVLK